MEEREIKQREIKRDGQIACNEIREIEQIQ